MRERYIARRAEILSKLEEGEVLLLYSGVPVPSSMDEDYPFEVNRHFYYLTGFRRANMALLLAKTGGTVRETLYIEQSIPALERWTGKRPTKPQAIRVSGIQDVQFLPKLESTINTICGREFPSAIYMDCHRESQQAPEMYNLTQANRLRGAYPGIVIRDAHPMISRLRMNKDEAEIEQFRQAIEYTHKGLDRVLRTLEPGMMEYAVQAEFEYEIRRLGAEHVSFPTIVGSGLNGCSLHYESNDSQIEPGSLVLLDLGARVQGYCADISRTYPADGHFTERQRAYYDLVLGANLEIARTAAPGKTVKELTEHCKSYLGDGLTRMGKTESSGEIGKYFMHGVSHFIGLDTHDVYDNLNRPLEPGMIISNEPGLYIDDEKIGIRIEDDLLITENGCEVLSAAIPKTADEIETIMKNRRQLSN